MRAKIKAKIRLWRRALLTKWLRFRYRNQDDMVCCCGDDMRLGARYGCIASCRSMKEYVITSEVDRRIP